MAPLGSLSARSRLAYAMGGISVEAYAAVDHGRELWNAAARSDTSFALAEEQVTPISNAFPLHLQMVVSATVKIFCGDAPVVVAALPEYMRADLPRVGRAASRDWGEFVSDQQPGDRTR